MQMAFFSVPARGDAGLQEDLNVFLRSHRALTVHREFVGQGENAFWALAMEYLDGPVPAGAGRLRALEVPGRFRQNQQPVRSDGPRYAAPIASIAPPSCSRRMNA